MFRQTSGIETVPTAILQHRNVHLRIVHRSEVPQRDVPWRSHREEVVGLSKLNFTTAHGRSDQIVSKSESCFHPTWKIQVEISETCNALINTMVSTFLFCSANLSANCKCCKKNHVTPWCKMQPAGMRHTASWSMGFWHSASLAADP